MYHLYFGSFRSFPIDPLRGLFWIDPRNTILIPFGPLNIASTFVLHTSSPGVNLTEASLNDMAASVRRHRPVTCSHRDSFFIPPQRSKPSRAPLDSPTAPMSGFDYSKWDRLEISDDETTPGRPSQRHPKKTIMRTGFARRCNFCFQSEYLCWTVIGRFEILEQSQPDTYSFA